MQVARAVRFDKDGLEQTGQLRIGPTRSLPDGTVACEVYIPELEPGVRLVYGEDAVQALVLGLRFADLSIRTANQSGHITMWWLERGDNCCILDSDEINGTELPTP